MQAIISARGLSISKTYKDALTRRLAKLEPLFPAITEVKVVLTKEKHRRTAAWWSNKLSALLRDGSFVMLGREKYWIGDRNTV